MPSHRLYRCKSPLTVLLFIILCSSSVNGYATSRLNAHEPQVSIVAVPEWIEVQNFEVGDLVELVSPSHYHLVDKQINGIQGKQVYSRFVYSLTDPSGIESNSNIRIRFNPAYETLQIHAIAVNRLGKLVNSLSPADVEVINVEDRQSSNIYSGEVEAVILLKDIRVADVIDYSYTIVGNNPVFADKFSAGATIGWSIPVDKVNVSVLMPAERAIQYKIFKSSAKLNVETTGQISTYRLGLTNTTEVYEEDNLPAWYNPYPYIQFSEYHNWQDVAQWANDLFDVEHIPSTDLATYISQLKTKPIDQAINEAIDFSQNQIRYLGLELGENSHRPHSPSETFANRQGDCKDKSLLLSVLLNQLGITANPALVSTSSRAHVSDYLPTHAVFDHAIVEIQLNGVSYWIDPTMTHQGSQLDSKFQADYGLALVVAPYTEGLTSARPAINFDSKIAVKEFIVAADYASPVEWTVTTTVTGREADSLRYRIKSEGQVKLAKAYLNFYAKRFAKIEPLRPLQIIDDRQQNIITVVEHYLVPEFWLLNAQQNAEFELHADYYSHYAQLPKSIKREQPLAMYPHLSINHKVTLQLPEHIDFSADEGTELFEDNFVNFASSIIYDRRLLTFQNSYTTKGEYVDVAQVPEHLALLSEIANRMNYYNSITNVTDDPGNIALQKLLLNLNQRRIAQKEKAGD